MVSLEELDGAECRRLLASTSIGRIGVTIDALPVILPVNFAMHDGAIVFRTVPGTKLEAATSNAVVAFEVDGDLGAEGGAWSVLARGVAEELTEPRAIGVAASLPIESESSDVEATHFVRITPSLLTGRRVHPDQHAR